MTKAKARRAAPAPTANPAPVFQRQDLARLASASCSSSSSVPEVLASSANIAGAGDQAGLNQLSGAVLS